MKIKKNSFLVLSLLLIVSCTKVHKHVFVLPHKYKGTVELVYNKVGFDDVSEIFVPDSGVVYTSERFVSGKLENTFYMLDSLGGKTKMKVINRFDDTDCNQIGVLNQLVSLNGNDDDPNSKYSYVFYVGTKKDLKWCFDHKNSISR